ncbi:FHA domain-containing protein [Novipirellula caenicola]|uniref:YscD cytoplasmic domain-containing protein n=1 Tax=Novipirellula caenicola TaxID=1536901 RepID=A0ABP9VIL5_9BACT
MNSDHTSDTAPFPNDDYAFGSLVEESSTASHADSAKPRDASSLFRSQQTIEDQLAFPYETLDVSSGQVPSLAASGTSLLSKPDETEAMEFRVISAGSPVRRLRLTGNRYTFGSAHGCSVQLGDRSLRPMHAVLIRDANQILVRAYSVPIEVNHVRTTEARLSVGDVMRLGNYQFELLASTKTSTQSITSDRFHHRSVTTSIAASNDRSGNPRDIAHLGQLDSTIAAGVYPSSRPTSPLGMTTAPSTPRRDFAPNVPMAEDAAWREQLRREVQQWRKRQEECERRESHCSQREHELRGRETELWSRAEDLYKREARLLSEESNARTIQTKYEQKKAEVARLLEENESNQRMLAKREIEFKSLEDNYRRQVEEAARQLTQSQQQAKTATDAIHRMREQFNKLNEQLEMLSANQEVLTREEVQNREEHRRIQRELEASRDEAIQERAKSESLRAEAEARLEEITRELEAIRSQRESERRIVAESEVVAQQLRDQIEELQQTVVRASEESSELRNNYGEARETIQQLETMLAENGERHEADRNSWLAEAEQLHQSVEALSVELANAHRELAELRDVNNEVTHRIDEIAKQRDQALAEIQVRPTSEAFDLVSAELGATTEQLSRMRAQYEEAIAELQDAFADRPSPAYDTPPSKSSSLSPYPALGLTPSSDNRLDNPLDVSPLSRISEADNEEASVIEAESSSETDLDDHRELAGSSSSETPSDDWVDHDAVGFEAGEEPTFDDTFGNSEQTDSESMSAYDVDNEAWPTYETPALQDREPLDHESAAAPGEQAQWLIEESTDAVESSVDDALEGVAESLTENSSDAVDRDSSVDEDHVVDDESVLEERPAAEEVTSSVWGTPSELLRDEPASEPTNETNGDARLEEDSVDLQSEASPSVSWATPSQLLDESATAGDSPQNASYDDGEDRAYDEDDDTDVSVSTWKTPSQLIDEEVAVATDSDSVDEDVVAMDDDTAEHAVDESSEVENIWSSLHSDYQRDDSSQYDDSAEHHDAEDNLESDHDHEAEALSDDQDDNVDDPYASMGSLASQLIQDIEADNASYESQPWDHRDAAHDADDSDDVHSPTGYDESSEPGEEVEVTSMFGEVEALDHDSQSESDDSYDEPALESDAVEHTRAWSYQDSQDAIDDEASVEDAMLNQSSVDALDAASDARIDSGERFDDHPSTDDVEDHDAAATDGSGEYGIEEHHRDPYNLGESDQEEIDEDAAVADDATVMSSETVVSDTQSTASQDAEDDEDSIEAYMNRLLKRVQGESTQPTESKTVSKSTQASTSVTDTRSSATATALGTTTAVATTVEADDSAYIDPDEPMVPRSQAPEKTSNLSAMRELANQSARNAISRSTRVQTRDTQIKAMSKFAQTGVAILCAVAMIMFTTWSLRYIAAIAIVVIGFVCFNEGIVLLSEAKKRLKAIEEDAAREQEQSGPTEEELKEQAEMAARLEAKLDLAVKPKKS